MKPSEKNTRRKIDVYVLFQGRIRFFLHRAEFSAPFSVISRHDLRRARSLSLVQCPLYFPHILTCQSRGHRFPPLWAEYDPGILHSQLENKHPFNRLVQ
jgi:hypothetical protein